MKSQICEFFSLALAAEEPVEIVKDVLFARCNSHIYSVFKALDNETKGYIDLDDLKNLLPSAEVEDLMAVLRSWSGNPQRKISYQDFLRWALPYNKFPRSISESYAQLSNDVKYSTARLFEKEIECTKKLENYKEKFSSHANNFLLKAFEMIAGGRKKAIGHEEFYDFLYRAGVQLNQQNFYGVFRRIDKDNDGSVSYYDFTEFFRVGNSQSLRSSQSKEEFRLNFKQSDDLKASSQRYIKPSIDSSSLINLFQGLIAHEKSLELNRNELALRVDFSIDLLFKLFDPKRKRVVSELDFDKGLKEFKIRATGNDIFLIYRHYDKNSDGLLDFSDFSDIFLAKKPEYAGLLSVRGISPQFSIETSQMLKKTFLLIIELEHHAEDLRRALSHSRITLQEAFQNLKKPKSQHFTIKEFRNILTVNRILPTNRDLKALVDRFDTNRDGLITYSDFVQELLPKAPNLSN